MTIEERIVKSYPCWDCGAEGVDCDICMNPPLQEAYKKGATDQKQIDIEKACKAHCNCCICIDKDCNGQDKNCNDYITFIKAMEE